MTRYLTIREAASQVRATEKTIRKWIKEGRFACCRPGGKILIATADFEAYLESTRERIRQDEDVRAILADLFARKRTA